MTSGTPPMKSILRTFEIVQTLSEVRNAGPSEIASHLGLSKSTAHVYLRSLQSAGYVINESGEYRLSSQFLMMGSRLKYRSRIFQVSKSDMWRLARETDELVTLFIEEEGQTVLFHQERGVQALKLGTYPGMTIPIHSHAAGKVFLAYMEDSRSQDILDEGGFEQRTEATVTDPESLRVEIEQIQEKGFAFDWDQQVQGMGAIAVPILVDDTLQAVLAIACPTRRLQNVEFRSEMRQKLQEKADSITINYQYGD